MTRWEKFYLAMFIFCTGSLGVDIITKIPIASTEFTLDAISVIVFLILFVSAPPRGN